jgi:hypothetical protein
MREEKLVASITVSSVNGDGLLRIPVDGESLAWMRVANRRRMLTARVR